MLRVDPDRLQLHLRDLALTARGIDLRGFEGRDSAAALRELVPAAQSALAGGIDVLGYVLDRYDPTEPYRGLGADSLGFYREVDRLLEGGQSAAQRLGDLAFMARWELRRKHEQVAAIHESRELWMILTACGSARRQVVKSATAVERALSEAEGLPPSLEGLYVSELDLSREVRRAYGRFRRGVVRGGEPPPERVVSRLRTAAVGIAQLVGRDCYESLRVVDRVQLRAVQARLIEQLRHPDAGGPRASLRLWQDVAAFAELLGGVNNRAELREHDLALAERALATMPPEQDDGAALDGALLEALRGLAGRSDEIDELIERRAAATAAEWRAPLRRIVDTLTPTASAPATAAGDFL